MCRRQTWYINWHVPKPFCSTAPLYTDANTDRHNSHVKNNPHILLIRLGVAAIVVSIVIKRIAITFHLILHETDFFFQVLRILKTFLAEEYDITWTFDRRLFFRHFY